MRFARTWVGRRLPSASAMQAIVTVVVPVYHTEQYLAACLASILNQSLRDIHVVVVDDGSSGAVRPIVQRAAGDDRRVTLLHHRQNKGTLAARLTGARLATSRYLAFVDSDDIVEPKFLETMHRTAESHDADVTECAIAVVEPDGSRWLINRNSRAYHDDAVFEAFLGGKMSNSLSNKLLRTARWQEAAARLGGAIGNLSFGDDLLMMFLISLSAGRHAHIDDPLYIYMRRPDSSTMAASKQADALRAYSLRKVWDAITPILERSSQSADLKRQFLEREFLHLMPEMFLHPL